MKRNSKKKGIIIALVVVLVLGAAGGGFWYFTQNSETEPVKVFPFNYIGMTEYWGDSQESYGPVTTDRIQTVFLSDTQSVTEVLVNQGDTVRKGDLLMTYDTTLSDLALERERLEVEKLKLQLENAQKELKDINKMKPMVIPSSKPEKEPEQDKGAALSGDYQISSNQKYDGSSQDKALILWAKDSLQLDDTLLEAVRQKAQSYQQANVPAPTEPAPTEPLPEESTEAPADTPETGETVAPSEEETVEPTVEPTTPPETTLPEPPVSVNVNAFFMVVKVTEGNMSMGYQKVWQGMEVKKGENGFSFRFFDASSVKDHMTPNQEITVPSVPQIDMGSGYTASQIAQMRSDKEKQIKDLKFQIKMKEADYAIKQTEAESGQVVAQIDGIVVSLLCEEEAKETMQPIMMLSGGGGFYVEGSVSELEKEKLQIGQEVTINDWNTGMEYTGTVQSVGDFPASDGYWNGMGNPNASYYPFTVFIEETADLQEGSYVNVVYSTATNQQGIYLENPFMRTEQGKTYVYVKGADGKLEQRFVTTGKALWGSYTEVLDGLAPEDFIAFPYGKDVKAGADTVESDLSELYG